MTSATTCPTAASRRRSSSRACGTRSVLPLSCKGDPFVALFSESAARALVTVPRGDDRLTALLAERGVPYTEIGVVTDSAELVVEGHFSVGLAELDEAYEGTLPALFG